MNYTILTGRTTKDIELNKIASGTSVCRFTLAVDKQFKQGEEKQANFFDIVCWGKLAETTSKYLTKGRKCCVTGSLDTRTYTAKDGTNRKVIEIVASEIEYLDSGNNEKEKPVHKQSEEVTQIFEPLSESELPF